MPFGLIKSELLWFLKGDSNIRYLLQHNNHIWDEWAFERYVQSADYTGPDMTDFGHRAQTDAAFNTVYRDQMQQFNERILDDEAFAKQYGELGDIYGKQWRAWQTRSGDTIDQIKNVIEQIKTNPDSRRLIVSAWNPEDVPSMALPPCHTMFQFYVNDGRLSCQLYQRSGDVSLAYHLTLRATHYWHIWLRMKPALKSVNSSIRWVMPIFYSNHIEQVKTQLERPIHAAPKLWLNPDKTSIFDFDVADIKLENYEAEPAIKAPVAV